MQKLKYSNNFLIDDIEIQCIKEIGVQLADGKNCEGRLICYVLGPPETQSGRLARERT